MAKQKQPRIAIIGAGPAGLSAAWYLKKKGYRHVQVFEKLDRVGGKCLSFEYEGRKFDLAAHEMLAGYNDVMGIANELKVPWEGDQTVLVYEQDSRKYLGIMEASQAGGYGKLQIMWASLRYTWMLLTRYCKFSQPGSGLADAPEELRQPISTWLKTRRLEALTETFLYVMKVQGYGRLDQIPAAYLVKFQGLRNWVSNVLHVIGLIKSWPRIFSNGFQSLWEAVAKQVDVKLNSDITAIRRVPQPGGNVIGVEIDFRDGETQLFDQIIVTCPMDIDSLNTLGLDLGEEESVLFSKIIYQEFITTACRVEGLPTGVVATIPVPSLMNYSGYIKIHKDSDMTIFFTPAESQDFSEHEVLTNIEAQVAGAPAYKGVQPRVIEKHKMKGWRYFPHVGLADYSAGFYEGVESIQGYRHTYYAGSLLAFETVGNTVAYTRQTIEKYFPAQ